MTDRATPLPVDTAARPPVRRGPREVAVTGMGVMSAYGHGTDALLSGVLSGQPAFETVRRFAVDARRTRVAATLPDAGDLRTELVRVIGEACDVAGLTAGERAATPLFLAIHGDPAMARAEAPSRSGCGPDAFAAGVQVRCGLSAASPRSYTSACVAASTALADAAAMIAQGLHDRVVVAGGYLVESDQFALFDAGRALADDAQVRPFSAGRRGLLLGDGVGAVVLEAAPAARKRRAPTLARLAGWGRSGDAYHPCQPHPEGHGLARAITAALCRAGIEPGQVGYLNAHGSGTKQSDPAECNALRLAFGDALGTIPVSSTKSLHGQALEASGVLELIATLVTVHKGMLPINAGFLALDDACRLNLVLGEPRRATPAYAMSINVAFGGANTALVLGMP